MSLRKFCSPTLPADHPLHCAAFRGAITFGLMTSA